MGLKIAETRITYKDVPDKISLGVFLYGCENRPCKDDCQNKHLHILPSEELCTISEDLLLDRISRYNILTNCIVISGGEPLLQEEDLKNFLDKLKERFPNKAVCLYTSYELEEVNEDLLKHLSFIKTGWYDKNKPTKNNFLASSNQKFYIKKEGLWTSY